MVRTRSSAKGLGVILVLTRFDDRGGRDEVPRVFGAGVRGWIPHCLHVTQCYIGARVRVAAGLMWLLSGSWNAL